VRVLDLEHLDQPLKDTGLVRDPDIVSDHLPPSTRTVGDDRDWKKLYFKPKEGSAVHVHVRAMGRANQRYALLPPW
jgi:hypothetical protein